MFAPHELQLRSLVVVAGTFTKVPWVQLERYAQTWFVTGIVDALYGVVANWYAVQMLPAGWHVVCKRYRVLALEPIASSKETA